MSEEVEKRRGAPRGNQNARKHGFYSRVLDEVERADFELATGVQGLDEEIALLRVKIKSLIAHDPDNMKLIMQGINTISRLITTKYNIRRDDKQGLREAIGNVLRDVAIPLGIVIEKAVGK